MPSYISLLRIIVLLPVILIFLLLFPQTASHYVAGAGLKSTMETQMVPSYRDLLSRAQLLKNVHCHNSVKSMF